MVIHHHHPKKTTSVQHTTYKPIRWSSSAFLLRSISSFVACSFYIFFLLLASTKNYDVPKYSEQTAYRGNCIYHGMAYLLVCLCEMWHTQTFFSIKIVYFRRSKKSSVSFQLRFLSLNVCSQSHNIFCKLQFFKFLLFFLLSLTKPSLFVGVCSVLFSSLCHVYFSLIFWCNRIVCELWNCVDRRKVEEEEKLVAKTKRME